MTRPHSVGLLGQTAGNWHLRAPLDLPVLTLLMAGDRPRRLLCDDFIPAATHSSVMFMLSRLILLL